MSSSTGSEALYMCAELRHTRICDVSRYVTHFKRENNLFLFKESLNTSPNDEVTNHEPLLDPNDEPLKKAYTSYNKEQRHPPTLGSSYENPGLESTTSRPVEDILKPPTKSKSISFLYL